MRDLARKQQMVRSIDPRRVTLRQFQWPFKVAAVLGTHVAETILASGHVRPRRKAAHMEANDPIEFFAHALQGEHNMELLDARRHATGRLRKPPLPHRRNPSGPSPDAYAACESGINVHFLALAAKATS